MILWDADAAYNEIILSAYIFSANKEISQKSGGKCLINSTYVVHWAGYVKSITKLNLSRDERQKGAYPNYTSGILGRVVDNG